MGAVSAQFALATVGLQLNVVPLIAKHHLTSTEQQFVPNDDGSPRNSIGSRLCSSRVGAGLRAIQQQQQQQQQHFLAKTVYATHLAATPALAVAEDMTRLAATLLLLALAAGASAAELTEIKAWAQCGGTSCSGGGCPDGPWQDTQCAEGFKCLRMTAFFW
jgi:hypothetical protein